MTTSETIVPGGELALPRSMTESVGSNTYPTLDRSNYGNWSLLIRDILQARGLWHVVEGDEDLTSYAGYRSDRLALDAILSAVPPDMLATLSAKATAKDAWNTIEILHMESERVSRVNAQTFGSEFEALSKLSTIGEAKERLAELRRCMEASRGGSAKSWLSLSLPGDDEESSHSGDDSMFLNILECAEIPQRRGRCRYCNEEGHWGRDCKKDAVWSLDTCVSTHMAGNHAAFTELDGGITGWNVSSSSWDWGFGDTAPEAFTMEFAFPPLDGTPPAVFGDEQATFAEAGPYEYWHNAMIGELDAIFDNTLLKID